MAVDDEGWMYVINKHVTPNFARVRFSVISIDDTYRPDIRPEPDGKPEVKGEETLPSPVCCTIDSNGTIYSSDETANKIVTYSRSGETLGCWGESGDGPGQLNAPSGLGRQPVGRQHPQPADTEVHAWRRVHLRLRRVRYRAGPAQLSVGHRGRPDQQQPARCRLAKRSGTAVRRERRVHAGNRRAG